jgi:hypothetical protein
VTTPFLLEALSQGTALYQAIEDVLKGKELNLPSDVSYCDKDGNVRDAMRIQWYRQPKPKETYASYALTSEEALPKKSLPPGAGDSAAPYPAAAHPVLFGHNWLRAQSPTRLAANVACVDYSVAKGGMLCAYRWDGEGTLDDAKFVAVDARSLNR